MADLRRVGLVALAALVVVDVVLVTFAIRHVRDDGAADHAAIEPSVSASSSEEGANQAKPSGDTGVGATPTDDVPRSGRLPEGDPASAARTLVDVGAGTAAGRARTGVCGRGGAEVELSDDGGRTFAPVDVPAAEVVLRIAVTDTEVTWLVGADVDCETYTVHRTSDGGRTWEISPGSDGAWHRTNQAGSELHAPQGMVSVPCVDEESVLDLSTLSPATAFALCADGTLAGTDSGGADWSELGRWPRAVAVDFVDASVGYLVRMGDPDCAGLAVARSDDGGQTWASAACVESDATGYPDLSTDGTTYYLAHDDAVWRSHDGQEWERRTR